MKSPRIETPTGQNWSCQGCTECCRGKFLVTVSAAEKERIEQQGWTVDDGVDPAGMIVPQGDRFRLAHQSNGACVFLDPSGRCRIHARFGESAKPLTCQMYPLVIHPAGKKLVVGLRFSCPAAAANQGRPMGEQVGAIQRLARLIAADELESIPPPPVLADDGNEWPELLRFVKWLDVSLADPDVPMALKLLRTLHWLAAVEKAGFDHITGSGADEILEALVTRATEKVPALAESAAKPSFVARFFLRLMVLEHARLVTVKEMEAPVQHRSKILGAVWRFILAGGHTPLLRDGLARVKFAAIEGGFGPLSPGIEALLTRYFRVKIQSLHFCGHGFHDRPLIEGFRNLALLFPMVMWLSRWLALSDHRTTEHFHYSTYISWRVKLLQQRNDIVRLCGWYGGSN